MSETLREAEARDPFAPHDPGCQCWPHVSQQAAIEAAVQAATAEYHEGKAALARSESPSPCRYCGSVSGETPPGAWQTDPLTGDALRRSINAACSLTNPRLSEVDWDAVAAVFESPSPEGLTEALRLVDEVIFDLPIGEDVTYSRGYSAGIAAARESLREALAARLRSSADSGTEGT